VNDHDGHAPECDDTKTDGSAWWWVLLHPYTKDDGVFVCPSWVRTPPPTGETDLPAPRNIGGIRGSYA
jgi:hypothetical protein